MLAGGFFWYNSGAIFLVFPALGMKTNLACYSQIHSYTCYYVSQRLVHVLFCKMIDCKNRSWYSMCNTSLGIMHTHRQLFKRFPQFFLIKLLFQCPNHLHCSIPVLVPLNFLLNVVPRTGYGSWSLILNCFCTRAIVEDSCNWYQHNRKSMKWLGKVGINQFFLWKWKLK